MLLDANRCFRHAQRGTSAAARASPAVVLAIPAGQAIAARVAHPGEGLGKCMPARLQTAQWHARADGPAKARERERRRGKSRATASRVDDSESAPAGSSSRRCYFRNSPFTQLSPLTTHPALAGSREQSVVGACDWCEPTSRRLGHPCAACEHRLRPTQGNDISS